MKIKFETMLIKFWEKKVTISGKIADILGSILMVLIGTFLLYCALNPLDFLKENLNRIIFGVIGVLLILKALRMLFANKFHKNAFFPPNYNVLLFMSTL